MPAARVTLWVTTVAALALAVRSIALGPVPFWAAFVATAGYLGLCALGIIFPRWEMFADVIERGQAGRSWVALTFDDGPDPSTTPQVLGLLRERNMRATFFVIGHKAEQSPDIVREIVSEGHELGIHGYAHDRLTAWHTPKQIADDIRQAQDTVERIVGQRVIWYRPPVGHVSPRTAVAVRRANVELVAWSVRALDGISRSNPSRVAARVARKLHDGAIILLHDASESGQFVPAGVRALPEILNAITSRGYTCVTLSELLAYEPEVANEG
jgi:peptidoglycan/xylan/chitin deacetylase (PgdA/CDA1 family)